MPRSSGAGRRAVIAGAAGLGAGRGIARAQAPQGARMVFLERADCRYCRRWRRDVGERAWNRSDLGRRAPLLRVDVAAGLPAALRFLANWRFTPSFVLVLDGRELGRIIGYNGDRFFWQQAEALLGRLPPA